VKTYTILTKCRKSGFTSAKYLLKALAIIFAMTISISAAPTINNCPSKITVYTEVDWLPTCGQYAYWDEPTATTNCQGGYSVNQTHYPYSYFSVGATIVT
jgi:hypothetical protein